MSRFHRRWEVKIKLKTSFSIIALTGATINHRGRVRLTEVPTSESPVQLGGDSVVQKQRKRLGERRNRHLAVEKRKPGDRHAAAAHVAEAAREVELMRRVGGTVGARRLYRAARPRAVVGFGAWEGPSGLDDSTVLLWLGLWLVSARGRYRRGSTTLPC